MKKFAVLILTLCIAVAVSGCGKKETVDTDKLESSFASADATTKSNVDQAIASIEKADYGRAVTQLQKAVASGKLTPEQEAAVRDVMEQLQKLAVENLNKAAEGANKALGDLQKSLSK